MEELGGVEDELAARRAELEELESMDAADVYESYNVHDYEDMCDGLRDRIEELESML